VEVGQSAQRSVLVGFGQVPASAVRGEQARQVAHPVAARNHLLDKGNPVQRAQQRTGPSGWQIGQRRGGGHADVRPGSQPEQHERRGLVGLESGIGPGQRGGHAGRGAVV